MKYYFNLFICLFFMSINNSFSQYIYIKGYGGGDRRLPDLIIARNYSDVKSLIDTSVLKEKFTKELLLLENKSDYERVFNFVRNYKGVTSACHQPMFFITSVSTQGNFEYSINGKDMLDFLYGLSECLKESMQYAELKNKFEHYQNRISSRF